MTENLFMRDTWRPQSFDEESSSVRVVAVTENPVRVWDQARRQYVDEVLMIDGYTLPPSGKIPLLDAHNRSSVTSVLGSARRFHPSGSALECDVFFSGTDAGRNAAQNVKEGHLSDFSVGYLPVESHYLKEGEVRELKGRTFSGPVKVTTRWNLRELSITPIGADQYATARSEDGYVPSPPVPMPEAQTVPVPETPPAVIPQARETPERSLPSAQAPPPEAAEINPPVHASQAEPARAAAVEPQAAGVPAEKEPDSGLRAEAAGKPDKKPSPKARSLGEQASERQSSPPPPPKPEEQVERSIVDIIFYAFLALMILFILKGMFL